MHFLTKLSAYLNKILNKKKFEKSVLKSLIKQHPKWFVMDQKNRVSFFIKELDIDYDKKKVNEKEWN